MISHIFILLRTQTINPSLLSKDFFIAIVFENIYLIDTWNWVVDIKNSYLLIHVESLTLKIVKTRFRGLFYRNFHRHVEITSDVVKDILLDIHNSTSIKMNQRTFFSLKDHVGDHVVAKLNLKVYSKTIDSQERSSKLKRVMSSRLQSFWDYMWNHAKDLDIVLISKLTLYDDQI